MTEKLIRIEAAMIAMISYSSSALPEKAYMAIAKGCTGYGSTQELAIKELMSELSKVVNEIMTHAG